MPSFADSTDHFPSSIVFCILVTVVPIYFYLQIFEEIEFVEKFDNTRTKQRHAPAK